MLLLEECEHLLLPTNCVGGLVATASEWQRCGLEVSWWDLVGFCVFLSFGETAIPHHVPKTNFKMVYVPFSIFLVYLFFLITNFYLPFFVFVCTSKKIVHSLICSRDVSLIFFCLSDLREQSAADCLYVFSPVWNGLPKRDEVKLILYEKLLRLNQAPWAERSPHDHTFCNWLVATLLLIWVYMLSGYNMCADFPCHCKCTYS